MPRYKLLDGVLIGLGVGLILMGGTMCFLVIDQGSKADAEARVEFEEYATTTYTGSEWTIVRKHTSTTVTDIVTIPPVAEQTVFPSAQIFNEILVKVMVIGGGGAVLGALLVLAAVVPRKVSKEKSSAPSEG